MLVSASVFVHPMVKNFFELGDRRNLLFKSLSGQLSIVFGTRVCPIQVVWPFSVSFGSVSPFFQSVCARRV